MTDETKKANKRRIESPLFRDRVFVGKGIDIGCGKDILDRKVFRKISSIEPFDVEAGDAQFVNEFRPQKSYDFVYSSNCLEHMNDPVTALKNWFSLVKEEGYLVFTVPDEDLYEQGFFPSIYNFGHQWTFTIRKNKSWSNKSINIIDLLTALDSCKIIKIELVDANYDYSRKNEDQTLGQAEAFIEVVLKKTANGK